MAERNKRGWWFLGALLLGLALSGCSDDSPEPLFQHLQSRDPAERQRAAFALERYGREIVPRLIEEMQSEHARVRFVVAQLLGKAKDPRAVPVLIEALDDESAGVAGKAAQALGLLQDARAVPGLIRALDHRSPEVAEQATWALEQLHAAESLPALLQYARDPSVPVRREVTRALGRCHSPAGEPALNDSARRAVLRALEDEAPEVRIAALEGAREFGYRGAAELVLLLADDPAPEVRHVAVQSLGELATGTAPEAGGPAPPELRERIVDRLIGALDEKSYPSIRAKAIRALADIGDPRGLAPLEWLEKEGPEEDRWEASKALRKFREKAGAGSAE